MYQLIKKMSDADLTRESYSLKLLRNFMLANNPNILGANDDNRIKAVK